MNKAQTLHFVTDLDRTLVHSKNPGYRCVEYMEERSITYMTEESYTTLHRLMAREDFLLIPCTMRNLRQVSRIELLEPTQLPVVICTNGAQIYLSGELDQEWETHMRTIVSETRVEMMYELICSLNLNAVEVRNVEEYYISLKFETDAQAEASISFIESAVPTEFKVFQVGRKAFVMHRFIDKYYAVSYLSEKMKWQRVVTAGDSEVDVLFTTIGQAILPHHASFRHEKAYITPRSGIHATDDLLKHIETQLL